MSRFLVFVLAVGLFASSAGGATRSAETNVHGVRVRALISPMHPFLAEYRRWVEITHAGKTTKKEVFADSGGYAWIVLRTRGGRLEVYDMGGVEFSIPIQGVGDSPRYLGRFDFDAQRNYVFIPASVDSGDPSIPFQAEKT